MSGRGVLVVEGARDRRVRGLTEKVAGIWSLRGRRRGDRVILEGSERALRRAARALASRGVTVHEGASAEIVRLAIVMENSMDAAEALIAAQDVADSLSEVVSRISRLMAEEMQAAYSQLATAVDPDAADRWREEVGSALDRLVKTALEAQSVAVRASGEVADRADGFAGEPRGEDSPLDTAADRRDTELPDEDDAAFADDFGPQRPRSAAHAEEEPETKRAEGRPEEEDTGSRETDRGVGESRASVGGYAPRRRRGHLSEAWGEETRPPKNERGKYAKATIEELCDIYRAYLRWAKGDGPKPKYKGKAADIREIIFALRAKSRKYRWGSAKKICGIED